MTDCAHPELRLSAEGVFCTNPDCNQRIDDDVAPIASDFNAQMRTVHQIDQAHGDANMRIDSLMEILARWRMASADKLADDATENPRVFYTIVQILSTRVDLNELPYMLSAAIMRLAKRES